MKLTSLLCCLTTLLITVSANSQENATISYYDYYHKPCKKKKAEIIEKTYKDESGNWVVVNLSANEKPLELISYKSKKREVRNGLYKRYNAYYWRNEEIDPETRIQESGYYVENKKEGKWLKYGSDHTLMEEAFYESDVLTGTYKKWCHGGFLVETGEYVNGEKEGEWKAWDCSTERLSQQFNYKNGVPHGEWYEWQYKVLVDSGRFVNGQREGDWSYEIDRIRYVCSYQDGELDGMYQSFYPYDALRDSGTYVQGKKVGYWKFYHLSGELAEDFIVKEGKYIDHHFYGTSGQEIPESDVEFSEAYFGKDPNNFNALYYWISDHVVYPSNLMEEGVSGTVYVSFTIDENGRLTDVKIRKSPHEDFSKEVIRLLGKMPKWTPAVRHVRPIKTQQTLPVKFLN